MKFPALRALLFGLAVTLVLVTNPRPGRAGGDDDHLTLIGAIPNPGPGATRLAVDISYVDHRSERYFLADVSNKAVDVFDVETGKLLGQITGNFHGFFNSATDNAQCNAPPNPGQGFDARGPSGVLVANDQRLWVTDFTGTNGVVKVFELEGAAPPFTTVPSTMVTVSFNSKCRADEFSFDPEDHIVLVGFPEPGGTPFIAFVSSDPPYNILGTLQFSTASGMEQPVWDPKLHRFLVNVPNIGIAVINPRDLDENPPPIYKGNEPACQGAGLALGPSQHLLIGCSGGPDVVMDARTGTVLKTFAATDVANSDEVWFNPGDGNFYASSNFTSASPALAVIDAEDITFLQDLPTAFGSHSVAASDENNHVFVPIQSVPTKPDVCHNTFPAIPANTGCIFVYAHHDD
jgi:hypothetical protein